MATLNKRITASNDDVMKCADKEQKMFFYAFILSEVTLGHLKGAMKWMIYYLNPFHVIT